MGNSIRARKISDRVSYVLAVLGVVLGGTLFLYPPENWGGPDLTASVIPGGWMAWTWSGVIFFASIACFLMGMIIWGIFAPETPRLGALRIETTPGDRLFISLLGSAFICLIWLATIGTPLWGGFAICLLYAASVFRWV